MSASPIDALLQLTPAPRAAEVPSRGGRDGRAFGPALEEAYASEKAREAPAAANEAPVDAAPEAAQGAYDEEDGQAETAETATEKADDANGSEEETLTDEVEVSELASVVLAADEAQAAVKAEEAAAAMLGRNAEKVHSPGDSQEPVNQEEAAADAIKLAGKLSDLHSGDGDQAANGEAANATATRGGKRTGDGVATATAESAGDQTIAATPAHGEQLLSETQPDASAERSPKDEKQQEPRSAKEDGAERPRLPPVDQSADLAAAIERQTKVAEASATDGAGTESPATSAVDAANSGSSTHRAAATLDRLAAAASRRGDEAAPADNGSQIDRPRFVQRVEGALRAAQQRDGRIQVRLAPPELGVVHIELAVQNGVMTAKLEAETAAARNALLDNLPALRERLAEQNIRVEKFDVDVRRDPQHGGSNNAPDDRRDGQGEPNSQARRARAVTNSMAAGTPSTVRMAGSASNSALDVRI